MSAEIKILRDEATPALSSLHASLAPARRRALCGVLGKKLEGVYRAWFRSREADSPNKMGWPRQHFWSRIAKATAFDPSQTTAERAVVVVSDPAIGMKVTGGTIRPKQAKFLAIPLRPEAYGVRPSARTIPGIFFVRSKGANGGFLATHEGKALRVYWRLVAKVTQQADPRALPPQGQVAAELLRTASSFVARQRS
jgi:hypothetical protein